MRALMLLSLLAPLALATCASGQTSLTRHTLDTCVNACLADDDGPIMSEVQCAQMCED
jgi:hypothetical protein